MVVLPTLQIISFSSTPPVNVDGLMTGTLSFEVLIPPTPGYPETTRTFTVKYCTNLFSKTVRTSKPIPSTAIDAATAHEEEWDREDILSLMDYPSEFYISIGAPYLREMNLTVFTLLTASLANEPLPLPSPVTLPEHSQEWMYKSLQHYDVETLRLSGELGNTYSPLLEVPRLQAPHAPMPHVS